MRYRQRKANENFVKKFAKKLQMSESLGEGTHHLTVFNNYDAISSTFA